MTEVLTDAELTALLERDYRRLLRWYPSTWRAAHGDALIGMLLDDAEDHDRFTVQRGDRRAFAVAGLRARLDRAVMRPVRDAAATVMLSMGTGAAVAVFVVGSWAPWLAGSPGFTASFGPFHDAGPVLTALWIVAFLAAQTGLWWVGRCALLLSVLVAAGMHWAEAEIAPPNFFSVDYGTLTFSAACALLAVLGTPRAGLRLLGASLGWAAVTGLASVLWGLEFVQNLLVLYPANPVGSISFAPGYAVAAVLIAVGVAVLLAVRGRWVPAFTVLLVAVPLTACIDALEILFLVDRSETAFSSAPAALVTVPVMLGVVVLMLASRGTIRLPNPAAAGGADTALRP